MKHWQLLKKKEGRNKKIVQAVKSGKSMASVGRMYGVSRQWVKRLCDDHFAGDGK